MIIAKKNISSKFLMMIIMFCEPTAIGNDNAYTGVIENVTNTIVEKNVIEYERDHDALTGLLNRRAFIRIMNSLFENEINKIKIAALLMLDLDNLKYINDNYGHEIGDNYISKAAETFVNSTPENTIISRISGDEFLFSFMVMMMKM